MLPCGYDNKRVRFGVRIRVMVRIKVRIKARVKVRTMAKARVRIRIKVNAKVRVRVRLSRNTPNHNRILSTVAIKYIGIIVFKNPSSESGQK